MLEAWAEDADGGELGALLQRYGAVPPSQALLTCLGRQADSAAEELVTRALAGTTLPSSCIHGMTIAVVSFCIALAQHGLHAPALADDVLGELLRQPGSLLGSLHSALQPIVSTAASLSAARQALRELRSDEGGSSTSQAAAQLSRQLQSLHLGQVLLRWVLLSPYPLTRTSP